MNMREALDARREALSRLSDQATEALRDAGHNPSLDTLRRISTTLEALSVATSLSDRTTLGRLTHDIDPPGFDSLGSLRAERQHNKARRGTAARQSFKDGSHCIEQGTKGPGRGEPA